MPLELSTASEGLACEKARTRALIDRDMDALATVVGDALVYTHASARVDNRETYLARMGSDAFVFVSAEYQDVAIQDHGDVAVVTGRLSMEAVPKGQPTTTQRFRFTGVWKREGGKWRLVAFQNTRADG